MAQYGDKIILKKILTPYKKHCRYLVSAVFQPQPFSEQSQKRHNKKVLLSAGGNFFIPESCYIAETGHFNAVEFNLCYNQLAYYLLAECIQHKLVNDLHEWNIDTFFDRQLSHVLIASLSSVFKKPITSKRFDGIVEIKKISRKGKSVFFKTTCTFRDDRGGLAVGDVIFVIFLH